VEGGDNFTKKRHPMRWRSAFLYTYFEHRSDVSTSVIFHSCASSVKSSSTVTSILFTLPLNSAPVECGMNALNEEPWQPNIYLNAETNTLFMDIKPEALVEIFNALGQEIWRGTARPILQLSGFFPGLYQVRVQQGTKRYIKTIGIY